MAYFISICHDIITFSIMDEYIEVNSNTKVEK